MSDPSDPVAPDHGQEPTGELPPGFAGIDPAALEALAAAGVEEGDFGEDHGVPPDLVELYEALEWQAAVEQEGGR